jgi:hypothetical protein
VVTTARSAAWRRGGVAAWRRGGVAAVIVRYGTYLDHPHARAVRSAECEVANQIYANYLRTDAAIRA